MTTSTTSIDQLVELVERQANVIVATGTGQGRFDDFDADYQRNDRQLVTQFRRLGLDPHSPGGRCGSGTATTRRSCRPTPPAGSMSQR